ncbi:MAG TPA: CCA tRNA nucleotidyltransferase [Candidatus Methanoculleus thermohydrogenotrophicum]|nr:CCA tRNA nucleotidyltransferase [Candidatus Methanoculleus thermohydrogenotrophicum]NLM81908.1 CCA tRNA nucleotidyltransferase [Candidatus Methanoculleus thermohydrogenotrophicum]HOB17825.1 CCA tRNA nucleotidyltransferase [Candidatus Methanoculleus thermohydrogenotrophicum]HPZ37991.1 CCA tRNA nucleotidyltransferase [Candidatus Methanoculleus thermohydrogenotrophicum]HQC91189.1 CCA tRNA nucleotidyltransferase [Candidatus Methanoculleus thermohydrogenotrophicum]
MTRCPCEEEVLRRIRPTPEERAYIRTIGERLIEAVERSGVAKAMMVGSVARDTFVRGDRDLDIFILFDPSLPREELQEKGLSLARRIADEFGAVWREKYAEHPYINATINSLDIDLVPCYAVASATEIKSAVDRTPFHTLYIQAHIDGYVDDVLLLKQFAKAGGVYGSDHMTEGFSGYLCEILVIYYGGFHPLLEAAAYWRPGEVIDIEEHGTKQFEDPLVVIDPVDPERNVAAALSLSRMFEFVELARGYLKEPSEAFFCPPSSPVLTREVFARLLAARGTHLFSITFATPDYTPDTVVPQLRKSAESIRGLLERSGFPTNRIDVCMQKDRCMLLFELMADEVPVMRRHIGPPVWSQGNARKFLEKYVHDEVLAGPYIEDGRYVVELPRPFTRAIDLLRSKALLDVALGKHVRRSMENGWTVNVGAGCWDEEFAGFVSGFLERSSPLVRIRRIMGK